MTSFSPVLEGLIVDMLDSMHEADGLGLAAPQIGVPLRAIVIEMPAEIDEEGHQVAPEELFVYCNPEIIETYGEEEHEEACLSVPGYAGTITRAAQVTVKGQDAKGRRIRTKAEGLLARAFQHEIDHLNGTLFIDLVDSPEKLRHVERGSEDETLPT